MGRSLNPLEPARPPVARLIREAPDVETLEVIRHEIFAIYLMGKLKASPRSMRVWETELWARVIELMRQQPRRAPFIFTVTLGWSKPHELHLELEKLMREVTAPLPSDAELLRAQGITIQGITS